MPKLVDLDDLKFGRPDHKQIEYMKRDTDMFSCTYEDLPRVSPPSNSSQTTLKELGKIRKASEKCVLDESFCKKADESIIGVYEDHLKERGLDIPEWVYEMDKQAGIFTLKLKFEYGRPRPLQLAEWLRVPLVPFRYSTSHSPAYPSGHAVGSYLQRMVLEDLYGPELGLGEMSASIAYSRLQGCVHYPSDTKYGIELAAFLYRHLKI